MACLRTNVTVCSCFFVGYMYTIPFSIGNIRTHFHAIILLVLKWELLMLSLVLMYFLDHYTLKNFILVKIFRVGFIIWFWVLCTSYLSELFILYFVFMQTMCDCHKTIERVVPLNTLEITRALLLPSIKPIDYSQLG